jgi:PEP-CTERM motif-containing protein
MTFRSATILAVSSLGLLAASANATELFFEGFAPAGGGMNVSPGVPYTEAGFTLTPSNALAAVFDAADPNASFPGDPTSWFGFAAGNIITMTGPAPFSLNSLLIGASSLGSGNTDFTVFADIFGGGTMTKTFTGLTAATLETLNWTNLRDVEFSGTTDSALDNITLNVAATPEPGTLLMLGAALSALMIFRHRRWSTR